MDLDGEVIFLRRRIAELEVRVTTLEGGGDANVSAPADQAAQAVGQPADPPAAAPPAAT